MRKPEWMGGSSDNDPTGRLKKRIQDKLEDPEYMKAMIAKSRERQKARLLERYDSLYHPDVLDTSVTDTWPVVCRQMTDGKNLAEWAKNTSLQELGRNMAQVLARYEDGAGAPSRDARSREAVVRSAVAGNVLNEVAWLAEAVDERNPDELVSFARLATVVAEERVKRRESEDPGEVSRRSVEVVEACDEAAYAFASCIMESSSNE